MIVGALLHVTVFSLLIAEWAFDLSTGVTTMDPSTPVADYPSCGSVLMHWALSPNGFIC